MKVHAVDPVQPLSYCLWWKTNCTALQSGLHMMRRYMWRVNSGSTVMPAIHVALYLGPQTELPR